MKYKAVIFDLDGVICHTDHFHYLAWKKIANQLNIPFDETTNERLRGVSRAESLNIILAGSNRCWTEEEKASLAEVKNNIYQQYLRQLAPCDLSEEVLQTLRALRSQGVRLAVGSSSKNTGLIVSQLGIGEFFDAVADGTEITHSKPDPEVFLLAAKKLNVRNDEALVIEDSEAGIKAAKAGGFYAVGFGESAKHIPADSHIRHFRELLEFLACETA